MDGGLTGQRVAVLVTGVGSTTALAVIKGLRQASEPFHIIGTDTHESHQIAGSSFCDAFYTVPPAVDSGFGDRLLEICQRECVQGLIPIVDPELEVMAKQRQRFSEQGVTVIVSDVSVIQTCNDKLATAHWFAQHEVLTPQTWLVSQVQPDSIPLPVVIKPRRGVGSVGVHVARSRNQLHEALRQVPDGVVQAYVAGPEYTIDVLCDLQGQDLVAVPRERQEVRAGISYKGRTVVHEGLVAEARRIAHELPIKGPCNIQCRIENEVPRFIEVNPRFSGSLPLTTAAGVNMPRLTLEMALGREVDTQSLRYRLGVTMTRYWQEVFYED